VGAVLVTAPFTALAQTWHVTPAISGELTFTNNVDLAPWSSPDRKSDWVLEIMPAIKFDERSAHTRFAGTISAPILLYARSGRNNELRPEVSVSGTADLYPRVFFVDASAQVSQQFVSPFAPRPIDLANATNNRLTAQSYRVAPYAKGDLRNDMHYELRDDNLWTVANGAGLFGGRSYTNEVVGHLSRDPRPVGWQLDYDRNDTRFEEQSGNFLSELWRATGVWSPDAQWRFSVRGGYEDNRYPLERFSGVVYGGALGWRPTPRTTVDAAWEHRFFGASYQVNLQHRTPLTIWSLVASRNITTYPQQLANFLAQGDVSTILNNLFASRITDPAQRQTIVDQLMRDRGLPTTINGPLSLVSQQITLQENVRGTAGILGVRNSILFSAYRTRNQPVTGATAVLSDLERAQTDNTQTGANVTWTYRITPRYTLGTTFDWVRTVANDVSGLRTRQGTLQSVLSAPLSLLTSGFVGARYQWIRSTSEDQVREAAVFVGLTHQFR
jgi:uncharacterized protein (PEP-CTERM system associated)